MAVEFGGRALNSPSRREGHRVCEISGWASANEVLRSVSSWIGM
jgi:hypothetical protein